MLRITVGLTGISFKHSFWGFEQEQFQQRSAEIKEFIEGLGHGFHGFPETFEDAEAAGQTAEKVNQNVDIVILDLATFPEGKAATTFLDEVNVPVILWSRGELIHNSHLGHNSFCGANFIGSNLALKGKRFRKLFGSVEDGEFRRRMGTAIALVAAAKSASNSKIGLIGGSVVPKFFDIDISKENRAILKKRWNISFEPIPMDEIISRYNACKDSNATEEVLLIKNSIDKITVTDSEVVEQARLLRTLKDIVEETGFVSLAVRCWPELLQQEGVAVCTSLSMLNEAGIPAACEGDLGGALDMLLAKQLSSTPATLLDIIDWDDKADTFSVWHCGPTAVSWADSDGTQLIHHCVSGATADGKKPACGSCGNVDMQFAEGPVTLFRTLGAIDDEFVVHGTLKNDPSRRITGSFGLVGEPVVYGEPLLARVVRNQILDRELPHHYTAVKENLFI